MHITEQLERIRREILLSGLSADLRVYKQLLPLGEDILNNNKAPIKFIIKLVSEGVDTFVSVGFGILNSKRAC